MIDRNRDHEAEGYGLSDAVVEPPALPGDVQVALTLDEVIDLLAADLVIHAEACVREFGDFHCALPGDGVLEPLYRRLMYDPNYRRLPWRRTQLWLLGERCVPFDDPRSEVRLLGETIGDHADIPPEQFHRIFPETPDAAEAYEHAIRETLSWREKGQDRLDYALLVVGRRGRIGGWPDAPLTDDRLVAWVNGGTEPGWVTLTPHFVNAARFVAVLATGLAVASVLQDIERGTAPGATGAIAPLQGELRWYLDEAACLA